MTDTQTPSPSAGAGHISISTPATTSSTSTTNSTRPLSTSPLSPARKSPMPPCSSSTLVPPGEIEATLTRLSSKPGVLGCLVLSRHDGLVIRSGGSMFDPSGPGAKQRAEMLKSVTRLVKGSVEGLARDIQQIDEGDELGLLRVRTKKYEIIITPNDKYLLVVLQDPNAVAQQS